LGEIVVGCGSGRRKVGGVMEGGGTVRVPVSRGPHWPVCVALFFWQPLATLGQLMARDVDSARTGLIDKKL